MQPLQILLVAPALSPTGGQDDVGEVVHALSNALSRLAVDVIAVAPQQAGSDPGGSDPEHWGLARRLDKLSVPLGSHRMELTVHEGVLPDGGGQVFVLDIAGASFSGPGAGASGADAGRGWLRGPTEELVLLGHAARALVRARRARPQVVHGFGAAAVACALFKSEAPEIACVITPDLPEPGGEPGPSGDLSGEAAVQLGLEAVLAGAAARVEAVPRTAAALGLAYTDALVLPSIEWAVQLQRDPGAARVPGWVRDWHRHLPRTARIWGIPHGMDTGRWDPERDPSIAQHYGAEQPDGKAQCKLALQRELGLPPRAKEPLLVALGPFDEAQRSVLGSALTDALGQLPAQLVFLLGPGSEPAMERTVRELATRFPTRVAFRSAAEPQRAEELAHKLVAGADFALLAHEFRPTAHSDLFPLRYGAVPIAPRGPGYSDLLVDFDAISATGNAFLYTSAAELPAALRRAAHAFRQRDSFALLVTRVMRLDLSWRAVALRYAEIYRAVTQGIARDFPREPAPAIAHDLPPAALPAPAHGGAAAITGTSPTR